MTEQALAAPIDTPEPRIGGFSRYQSALVALLALVQFTIILDFTIMSPLGAIIMPSLGITAGQFGVAVSAYAFSAGILRRAWRARMCQNARAGRGMGLISRLAPWNPKDKNALRRRARARPFRLCG